MAGGCCGHRNGVHYEVTFKDGTKQVYDTVGKAQKAGNDTGQPFTFKAVPAK